MKYVLTYNSSTMTHQVECHGPTPDHYGTVELTDDQLDRFLDWRMGKGNIQDLLPDLDEDEREMLLTGMGPEQWDSLFK